MKIHVLSDEVVNKISAGEVVERPASVVRELVDNAVDSGANDILVELEAGGQRSIRVCDNGCGMTRAELLLAFQRHATSKITRAEDLLSISTMGFRGEALPSIAAVSKVVVKSRDSLSELSTHLSMDGGKIISVESVSGNLGTSFEVCNLFYNTPARRKFLKSERSEVARIKTWIQNSSLAYPNIRYRLIVDGREVLNLARASSTQDRAAKQFRGTVVPFQCCVGDMTLEGLVGHPSLAHFETAAFIILVNGRLVSDRMLLRAVKEGFDSTLKEREFPVGYIHWRVAPADVDVNVHPQKSEVRFRSSGQLFGYTRDAVMKAVKSFRCTQESSPPIALALGAVVPDKPPAFVSQNLGLQFSGGLAIAQKREISDDIRSLGVSVHDELLTFDRSNSLPKFSELRYVGQILSCYLLCEHQEALYVVDMHAAHERFNYNLIRNMFRSREVTSQQLLVPLSISLSAEGVIRCMEQREKYRQFGFEWDDLGSDTLVVRAVPSILNNDGIFSMVRDLAALCSEESLESSFEKEVDRVAARLACHASIRSGRKLDTPEVYALFGSLDSTEFSAACPHGRPVVVRFSAAEIEHWFGRDS